MFIRKIPRCLKDYIGSEPSGRRFKSYPAHNGPVAQLAEHLSVFRQPSSDRKFYYLRCLKDYISQIT